MKKQNWWISKVLTLWKNLEFLFGCSVLTEEIALDYTAP